MLDNLHWLGHSSFRLEGLKTIYFDPINLPKKSPKADIILITHDHNDHYSLPDLKIICASHSFIVTDNSVAKRLSKEKLPCKEIKALAPGDYIDVYGVKINAVSSYNINKQFHTRESKKLGFIVTTDGIKIYHAGDTDETPQMKDYECDIALMPVSGTYVMTARQAAHAALTIKPKVAIPMHYGSIAGSERDAIRFKDLLRGRIDVRILTKES